MTNGRTERKAFYNFPTTAFGRWQEIIIFLPKIQAMKMNATGTDTETHYKEFHTQDEGTALISRNLLSQIMTKYFLYLTSICRYHGCFINLWETVS